MVLLQRLAHPLVTVATAAALAALLGIGAWLEAARGGAVARAAIWSSPAFEVLLAIAAAHLALVLLVQLRRRSGPWPLAALHAGLLLLALGTLWTRGAGAIGTATMTVGASTDAFDLPATELRARWGENEEAVADLGIAPARGPVRWNGGKGPALRIVDVAADAQLRVGIGPGGPTDGPGIALRFRTLNTSFPTWLLGGTPFFRQKQVGPFEVEHLVAPDEETLQQWLPAQSADSGQITVVLAGSRQRVQLDLPRDVGKEQAFGDVIVVAHRFLVRARLLGEQLVDDASADVNPAAIVAVKKGDTVETHTVFSLKPEFNLVAGRGGTGLVEAIELAANGVGKHRRVRILGAPDGRHFVQLLAPTERGAAWPLAIGKSVVLGDLGFDVVLDEALPHAIARAWPQPAAPQGSGSDFVCVASGDGNGEWLRRGADVTLQVDGKPVLLTCRARRASFPFAVSVTAAEVERRPGSTAPARYTSELAIRDGDATAQRAKLGNNSPADWAGHRLVQRGYAPGRDEQNATVVLAVGREPGRHVVHAGLALLLVGAFGLVWRHRSRPQISALLLLALGGAVASPLSAQSVAGMPLAQTRDWPIQADGRIHPLEAWARSQLVAVGGASALDSIEPLEFLWGLQFAPATVRQRPLVRVTGAELRRSLLLSEDRRALSYDELLAHPTFRAHVEAAQAELPENAERQPAAEQALVVYDRLLAMAAITDGTALRLLPTGRADGAWASLADLRGDGSVQAQRLLKELQAMAAASKEGNSAAFAEHADAFRRLVVGATAGGIDGAAARRWELLHLDLDASTRALALYLLASVLLGFGAQRRWSWRIGAAAAGLALLLQVASAIAVTAATGRLPVESPQQGLRFAATAVMAIAFVLAKRTSTRAPVVAAAPISLATLLLAGAMPTVDAFAPLPPGLADTAWLSVHGAATAAALGALALAAVLAHAVALRRRADERLLRALTAARGLGTALLLAGVASGVMWAEQGWGRQFGFEPRETWAAGTALLYLAVALLQTHGLLSPLAQAVAAIAAFTAAVGTWFAVDAIYGPGLHARATTASTSPALAWFAFEAIFVAAAFAWRRVVPTPA